MREFPALVLKEVAPGVGQEGGRAVPGLYLAVTSGRTERAG